jgi:hypothetical protein
MFKYGSFAYPNQAYDKALNWVGKVLSTTGLAENVGRTRLCLSGCGEAETGLCDTLCRLTNDLVSPANSRLACPSSRANGRSHHAWT